MLTESDTKPNKVRDATNPHSQGTQYAACSTKPDAMYVPMRTNAKRKEQTHLNCDFLSFSFCASLTVNKYRQENNKNTNASVNVIKLPQRMYPNDLGIHHKLICFNHSDGSVCANAVNVGSNFN